MEDFHPEKDRLRQARQADTLARLRAAAPGAAARMEAAAVQEPDPSRIHLGLLRRNFPGQWFPVGWVPDLRSLGDLAWLRAYFSRPAAPRRAPNAQHAEAFALFSRRFGRRSIWSRLTFWR